MRVTRGTSHNIVVSQRWLIYIVTILLSSFHDGMASKLVPPDSVAAQYSLTATSSLPFPTATQSAGDAQVFMSSQWSLYNGRVSWGGSDIAFVSDPFPNNPAPVSATSTSLSTDPVLQITYPAESYSGGTGGAQWYNQWNSTDGSSFNSMLLSYELAFDSNFDWVKGGKLPGLRGGPDAFGCSGGNQPTGTDCFSTRLMWRSGADNIECNSDYGISVDRGAFGFATGQWMRITMLVQMNDPPDVANGNVVLYFNDVMAFSQQNLQFRSGAGVNIGGIFFSTFFGGSDSSWATPQTVHTYYRNFQLYGSSAPSNLTGQKVGSTTRFTNSSWTPILAGLINFIVYTFF
ncbi:polysaccharide lyase family 14 protein [Scleroderma yunnanense]